MHKGGRHIYAVFMCHLSIEKALKALYYEKKRRMPPKSHNLIFFLNKIGIRPPEREGRFIAKITEASIPTRCPDDLAKVLAVYGEDVVKDIISNGLETSHG
jgi:HEPN domain-containing protein